MSEIGPRALDAPVTPIPFLLGHSNQQRLDLAGDGRPSWSPLGGAVVFLGDQLPMPDQQRLRCDDGGNLRRKLPS